MKVKGYYFLRNYKATHRARIEDAISRAGLNGIILIQDTAYGEQGVLPQKIAVFCREDQRDAECLFFQHYEIVRAEARAQLLRGPRFA